MSTTWITTSPLAKTYTLEEFWELPDPADRSKLELIAGVLYVTPPPEYTHDNVVTRLIRSLTEYQIATGDKGKLYVPRAAIWTGPNTFLEPDLFYLSAELEARLDPKHRTTADLVVEVLSPGSAFYDRNTKADTYAVLGVRELWLVDETNRTVEVRALEGNRYGASRSFGAGESVESSVLAGLRLAVEDLFQ
jgi:Uma2 family endonuclease